VLTANPLDDITNPACRFSRPSMASGASDSMWFRHHGVPSYGASPVFIKSSDDFSHGLNERIPISNTAPGITYYLSLLAALAK